MRFGIARLEDESAAEKIDGARRRVLIQGEHAEIVEGAFVLRVHLKRRFIKISRCGGVALSKTKIPERKISFGVVRHQSVGPLEMMLRDAKIIFFQSEAAGIVSLQRPERGIVTRYRDK